MLDKEDYFRPFISNSSNYEEGSVKDLIDGYASYAARIVEPIDVEKQVKRLQEAGSLLPPMAHPGIIGLIAQVENSKITGSRRERRQPRTFYEIDQ